MGSKGETLAAGLVPVMLSPELTEDSVTVSLPQRIKNIGSKNKYNNTTLSIKYTIQITFV